jgi:hypothetical protein
MHESSKFDQIECINKSGKRIFLSRHLTEDAKFMQQNGVTIAPKLAPIKEYKPEPKVQAQVAEAPKVDENGDVISEPKATIVKPKVKAKTIKK